jgi:hypothetical protein
MMSRSLQFGVSGSVIVTSLHYSWYQWTLGAHSWQVCGGCGVVPCVCGQDGRLRELPKKRGMKLAPTRPFPAVWGQRIGYCNVSALLVVAMDIIRGTLLASVPRVWSSPVCVWTTWAVTRAPKKRWHEMSEKAHFEANSRKVKAPVRLCLLPALHVGTGTRESHLLSSCQY